MRGYLLTAERQFIEPYEDGLRDESRAYRELQALEPAGGPEVAALVREIRDRALVWRTSFVAAGPGHRAVGRDGAAGRAAGRQAALRPRPRVAGEPQDGARGPAGRGARGLLRRHPGAAHRPLRGRRDDPRQPRAGRDRPQPDRHAAAGCPGQRRPAGRLGRLRYAAAAARRPARDRPAGRRRRGDARAHRGRARGGRRGARRGPGERRRARALERRPRAVRLRRLPRPPGAAAQDVELRRPARPPLPGPARRARRAGTSRSSSTAPGVCSC